MLRSIDKLLLVILSMAIFYYYARKTFSNYKVKKFKDQATASDKRVMSGLDKIGYHIIDICPAKRIQYYKDGVSQHEYIEPKLVVRNNGSKLIVERYTSSNSITLRDYQTKLKIITNMVCYNIKGVLFIDSKGENIRECSIKISHDFLLIRILNKTVILALFVLVGFYLSRFML